MRVDWEVINGITGIIGAVIAVLSIAQISKNRPRAENLKFKSKKFFHYVLASSCWALLVLIAHWFFDPLGPIVTRDEELKIFAVALSFPVVVGFVYSLKGMGVIKGSK